MAVLLAVLGMIGGVAFWLWRVNMGIQAGRELSEEARGLYRRAAWARRKGSADRLRELDDPREAATLLMIGIARVEGGPTPGQQTQIQSEMIATFDMSDAETEALYAHAVWMGADIAEISGRMRQVTGPIFSHCTNDEAKDVERMLRAVASKESEATPLQLQIIDAYARMRRETFS